MKYKKKIASTEIEKINLESIKDGEYEGFYDVYYLNARVAVKVEDNKIVSIELIEHKYDRYSGEPMIQQVLDNQSLDVDAISGATNSCKTVLKAIEIALSKGKI
ncbi:FMN-binding protein [Desulfamplus magnetovallimortis]|nr:FMN-binding protein [Desulfamplus magnetovallimortis]